jgi:uncharacterized protein YneF (UPF0154 family)
MIIFILILVVIAVASSFVVGMFVGRQNINLVDKGAHISRESLERLKDKADKVREEGKL